MSDATSSGRYNPHMTTKIERYWNEYLDSIPLGENRPCRYVESFSFGFTAVDALEIAALVLSGTKTATGSVLRSY